MRNSQRRAAERARRRRRRTATAAAVAVAEGREAVRKEGRELCTELGEEDAPEATDKGSE